MITENEIIEILNKHLEPDNSGAFAVYHDNFINIAKAIIDKIKEKKNKSTKLSFNTEINKEDE